MNIKPIKTEKDYQEALSRVDKLWEAEPNTEKGDELTVLAILIENYENENYKIASPDPIEAIKFRMEQAGMSKADLAKYLGGRNRSTEILSRKRRLSVTMLKNLYNKLDIPAESLLSEGKFLRRPIRKPPARRRGSKAQAQ